MSNSNSTEVPPELLEGRQSDGQFRALNPFTMVFVGTAYLIIFLYVLRYAFNLLRNLVARGRFGQVEEEEEERADVGSLRSESLPSFYKVVVLPDKDVCTGFVPEDHRQQKDDTEEESKEQEYRIQLVGQNNSEQQSEIREHNINNNGNTSTNANTINANNIPIRFFTTTPIDVEQEITDVLTTDTQQPVQANEAEEQTQSFSQQTSDSTQ